MHTTASRNVVKNYDIFHIISSTGVVRSKKIRKKSYIYDIKNVGYEIINGKMISKSYNFYEKKFISYIDRMLTSFFRRKRICTNILC